MKNFAGFLILIQAAAALLVAFARPGTPHAISVDLDTQSLHVQPELQAIQTKGRMVPRQWVSLSFPAPGRVKEVQVKEGELVSAGSRLARLDGLPKYEARIAQAELELLSARQTLDDLTRHAGVDVALAELRLAEARKLQERAYWKVKSMREPAPALDIEQAHANLLLLEKGLERARKDLRRAEKLWKDDGSPVWWFLSRHAFKLNLVQMKGRIAQLEGEYDDRLDRYNDLKKPVDEIDLAVAEADLAEADARVEEANRDREALLNGPDPDDLALALARVHSAEQALRAAQAALSAAQLNAPFSGQVISIPAQAGEWIGLGQPIMILADLSGWNVEIQDLKEGEVLALQEGQAVRIVLDALPGEEFSGRVGTISLVNGEKDGEVTYAVKIALQEHDPRFRWGMTARIKDDQ